MVSGARAHRLEAECGKGAYVDEIDLGMTAEVFVALDELGAVRCRKSAARLLGHVGARADAVADILVGSGVQVRDGARPDDADSHYLVRRGAPPHDLYLATFGRSTMFATLYCLVRGLLT